MSRRLSIWCGTVIVALGLTATSASAQVVQVTSGEHADFTRLVLSFPDAVNWTVARTETGYGLRTGAKRYRYDLSQAFDKIPKTRLTTIAADPQTGALMLGIGCACHAMPFELRPGIVVIDVSDGPAPDGSSFELRADGSVAPALVAQGVQRPLPRSAEAVPPARPGALPDPTTWQRDVQAASRQSSGAVPLPPEMAEVAPGLDALRQTLLQQIGKGATDGSVEIVETLPKAQPARPDSAAQSQIRIGTDLGLDPDAGARAPDRMTGQGANCLTDDQLDIAGWGAEGPVAETIGPVLSGMIGEFDHPNPEAINRAVRYLLNIGFGQEALEILDNLEIAAPDRAILETLAHVIEQHEVPGSVFAGMEVCDTAAALWAVLSMPHPEIGRDPRRQAVIRNFSALPLNLRRHLGPGLAERFMAQDDMETTRAIRDAVLRAPGEAGGAVRLMEAQFDLAKGEEEQGKDTLATLTAEPGPTGIEASIALVHAQVAAGETVDPGLITRLQSDLFEANGGSREADLSNAIALALATQNQFAAAFEIHPPRSPEALAIWNILATRGSDSELLLHAVAPDAAALPDVGPTVDRQIANRLLSLGFAEAALQWLDPQRPGRTREDGLARAKAQMMLRDPRSAVAALDGLAGVEAEAMRAEAYAAMGDPRAQQTYAGMEATTEQVTLARRNQDWGLVTSLAPDDIWGAAASLVAPSPDAPAGGEASPLADGRAAVADSAASREVLEALLRDLRAAEPSN